MSSVTTDSAVYRPFLSGRYRVESGISKLGRDFGNGPADALVFQLDADFPRFRENLEGARADDLNKYYGVTDAYRPVSSAVHSFIARRLEFEHPDHFALERNGSAAVLHCRLTGDVLEFDADFEFVSSSDPRHGSGLDALASQVQEDLAVIVTDDAGDWLVALHVTAPSYWDPSEKLGHDFPAVHEPVPHVERVNQAAHKQFLTFQKGGRYTRFAWGANSANRLNRHPRRPHWFEGSQAQWDPPRFDPADPRLYVSVERQTLVGLQSCTLFTIHPYFIDAGSLPAEERRLLADAIESMSPESREYKSLARDCDAVVHWLRS